MQSIRRLPYVGWQCNAGETFEINFIAENNGADGYINVEVLVDGELAATKMIAVSAGSFRIVTIPLTLALWEGRFRKEFLLPSFMRTQRKQRCFPSHAGSTVLHYSPVFRTVPFPGKCSFVSFTTIPDSSSSAIRFGMLISPLNVSAMSQSSPKSSVAPRIDTNE